MYNNFLSLSIIRGPSGDIYFEFLQLLLIIHCLYWFYINKNNILFYLAILPLIIHGLRLFLNFKKILKKNTNLLIKTLSIIIIFIYVFNKFNVKKYAVIITILYFVLAIYHFILNNTYHDKNHLFFKNKYYFIPFTILLGILSWLFRNQDIFPFLFGDFMYHIVSLNYYKM